MDSFEINKMLGAVLFTLLVVMALGILSEEIFAPAIPEKPGFVIEVADATPANDAAPAAEADPPIATLMANANATNGQAIAKKCAACHNFVEGAGTKVGPDLYSVLGRPIGTMQGFKYSASFQKAAAAGEKWTYEHLYHFLKKPSVDMAGTAMGFAGLPKPQDRADVIAYLRTLAATPEALPTADAAPAAPATATPPPAK